MNNGNDHLEMVRRLVRVHWLVRREPTTVMGSHKCQRNESKYDSHLPFPILFWESSADVDVASRVIGIGLKKISGCPSCAIFETDEANL